MCTVTFVPRASDYLLGMNRDEQLNRVAALPPEVHELGAVQTLFPYEPEGGTWIGVNEAGVAFALVNWYAVTRRLDGATVSRGRIPVAALACTEPGQVETALASLPLPLPRVKPFRLLGVFPRIRVGWEALLVVVHVHGAGERDLPEVVAAMRRAGRAARLAQRRQEQAGQDRNNGHDDQQFNE